MMPLSRCSVVSRENQRCDLAAEHPDLVHSFSPIPPGPPGWPPSSLHGERYETEEEEWRRIKRCFACASDAHSKCSGHGYCECQCVNDRAVTSS